MISYNTSIVLIGAGLLGACSGLVGSFAVLRKRALTGDALAHAALPGLCVAFLVVGERSLPAMLFGALVSGVLGVILVSALQRWTRIKEDAALGIVLSVFFGAGIVLSRIIQNQTTAGSKAGLDSYIFGKTAGMIAQDVYLIAGISAGCLAAVVILYKEYKLVSFDPSFARVQGWPAFILDLSLMTLVATTVVIGLPAVGVVLMAALLIIPAVAARFWTDRLERMLALSSLFGAVVGVVGAAISAQAANAPAGPIIVLTGATIFLFSALFARRRGLIARFFAQRRFRRDLAERELLATLYDLCEGDLPARRVILLDEIAAVRSWPRAEIVARLRIAQRDGYIERRDAASMRFTDSGQQRAAEVAKGRRLWERFLLEYADQAGIFADLSHESPESVLSPAIVDELISDLRRDGRWPRGLNDSVRSGASS